MTKKKNEKVFETPQQEIAFLKKQVAGLKGCNTTILKEREDLNKCVTQLLDEKARYEKINKGLESQVGELSSQIKTVKALAKDEADVLRAEIRHFKSLPWYKRIFIK